MKQETERQLYQMAYHSPVGELTLISDREVLLSLEFEQRRHPFVQPEGSCLTLLSLSLEHREKAGMPKPLCQAVRWLDSYFSGQEPDFFPPVRLEGSEFRLRVWRELKNIPYGETVTYGAIAKKLAEQTGRSHMSSQAVGGAVGRNPIGIIIPCHRVIGADGSLTGFGGGLEVKRALLELEKAR